MTIRPGRVCLRFLHTTFSSVVTSCSKPTFFCWGPTGATTLLTKAATPAYVCLVYGIQQHVYALSRIIHLHVRRIL